MRRRSAAPHKLCCAPRAIGACSGQRCTLGARRAGKHRSALPRIRGCRGPMFRFASAGQPAAIAVHGAPIRASRAHAQTGRTDARGRHAAQRGVFSLLFDLSVFLQEARQFENAQEQAQSASFNRAARVPGTRSTSPPVNAFHDSLLLGGAAVASTKTGFVIGPPRPARLEGKFTHLQPFMSIIFLQILVTCHRVGAWRASR